MEEKNLEGNDADEDKLNGFGKSTEKSSKGDSTIKVYARIRPSRNPSRNFSIEEKKLLFRIPRSQEQGFVNNQAEEYEFKFTEILNEEAKQETVFDVVSLPVIKNVLEGFNGTIFAYGQTGAGKTYTITGGPEKYEDRGMIPRTLTFLFNEIEQQNDWNYTVRISYLEIYNNKGYDLLDPDHETKKLEDLPRVSILEDQSGNCRLTNIGRLNVKSEEDALNLLFVGDTNRIICETPSNDASSRSHCIFTIHLEAKQVGGSLIRYSKMHLVDLAGSERIKKTNVDGKIKNEAVNINLSLHYLQQVIVALHKKAQGHGAYIPYRNSFMTSVLKDSLGGNCMTSMVANLSVMQEHLDESIGTCRFATRVAMIKNKAILNEELDPKMVIKELKFKVRELQQELLIVKGEDPSFRNEPLTDEEKDHCKGLVRKYIEDKMNNGNPVLDVIDPRKIQECFLIMFSYVASAGKRIKSIDHDGENSFSVSEDSSRKVTALQNEIKRLKLSIQARDNEIGVLVSMLKQKGGDRDQRVQNLSLGNFASVSNSKENSLSNNLVENKLELNIDPETLLNRNSSFEAFRKSYKKNQIIEENKNLLREKYHLAKRLGEEVNNCRKGINQKKTIIEKTKLRNEMRTLVEDANNPSNDEQDNQLREEMEQLKVEYRNKYNSLKKLKVEIEHLQGLLEKSRKRLQSDFEKWWQQALYVQKQRENDKSNNVTSIRNPSEEKISTYKHSENIYKSNVSKPEELPMKPPTSKQISTGNPKADADIEAFYKLRDALVKKMND